MWPENRPLLAPLPAAPALQVAPASIHAPATLALVASAKGHWSAPPPGFYNPMVGICHHGLSKHWRSPCVEQIVS